MDSASAMPPSGHDADSSRAGNRAPNHLLQGLATAAQISLLWFFSWAGHQVVALLNLPLPGNAAGLLLTFGALLCGVVPLRSVEQGATLLLRFLPLFFVPLAVGLGSIGDVLLSSFAVIVLCLTGSTVVGFTVTGKIAQRVAEAQRNRAAATRRPHVRVCPDR